jgi:hypothetical protein
MYVRYIRPPFNNLKVLSYYTRDFIKGLLCNKSTIEKHSKVYLIHDTFYK